MSNDNNFESMFFDPQRAKLNILSLFKTACDAVGGDPALLVVDEAQNWALPQSAHIDLGGLVLGLVVDEAQSCDLPQWTHIRTF